MKPTNANLFCGILKWQWGEKEGGRKQIKKTLYVHLSVRLRLEGLNSVLHGFMAYSNE